MYEPDHLANAPASHAMSDGKIVRKQSDWEMGGEKNLPCVFK